MTEKSSKAPQQAPGEPPPALLAALKRLLKPLVRLLIAYRITYPVFSNLLKSIYIEVADNEFPLAGKKQTDSRLSLITGVHRKDVRRLRDALAPDDAVPATVSLGGQLAARWLAHYTDADGKPLPLPKLAAGSTQPSFDHLVQSISKDIRPRAVLDEWLRLGAVHIDSEKRVVLNTAAFVPEHGFDEKAFYFGRNLRDHIDAGASNLIGGKPAYFDRSAHYSNLSHASVWRLQESAASQASQALQEFNALALKLQKQDQGKPGASQRINFGMYLFSAYMAKTDAGKEDDK